MFQLLTDPEETSKKTTSDPQPVRLQTSDRSVFNRPSVTRNVRTSSMPGNPTNQIDDGRSTIDEAFSESYKTAGIQPQGLGTEPKREKYQQPKQIDRSARVVHKKTMQGAAGVAQDKVLRKKKIGVKKKFSQKRAVVVTGSIWAWAFPSWLFFQLPIAILGLLLLGMAGGIDAFLSNGTLASTEETGYFTDLAGDLIGYLYEGALQIIKVVFGIDFDPRFFFLLPILIVFMFGLIVVFLTYFIYKINLLNPLSGQAAEMKLSTLLLVIVGYSFPLLNLFPWFFVWTLVVLKNPK